jgi:hypothetical protein
MWKIQNINNLSPISVDMWMALGSITTAELLECQKSALEGVTLSNKPPQFISQWPMTAWEYKCRLEAGAKIRGVLVTNSSRLDDHKSKFWNWLRLFFCCSCHKYTPGACAGEIVWFNHAVWYMMNHLESFFDAATIQGRLVFLIKFLSNDARKMVKDQLGFINIQKYMLEGSIELANHPEERFFSHLPKHKALQTIEALIKPGSFTDAQSAKLKAAIDLLRSNKRKGMYANTTGYHGRGRGRTNGTGRTGSIGRGAAIRSIRGGHTRRISFSRPQQPISQIGAPLQQRHPPPSVPSVIANPQVDQSDKPTFVGP